MSRIHPDPVFTRALRAELVQHASQAGTSSARRSVMTPRRRWIVGTASLAALATAGGTAYALSLAPRGGQDVVVRAATVVHEHRGSAVVDLGRRPESATAVRVEFFCLGAGTFEFPNGSSAVCSNSDARGGPNAGSPNLTDRYDLARGQHQILIQGTPDAPWRLMTTYVSSTDVPWGTNAKGETYGVANDKGEPDLTLVEATNGSLGYVYTRDMTRTPKSLADALQASAQNQALTLTVYSSDGETVIGQFTIGGPDTGP